MAASFFRTTKQRPLKQRWTEKVNKTPTCWIWVAATNGRYGVLGRGDGSNRWDYAHRIAWELYRGPIPEGMRVLHTCDNGLCVRPKHLWLGTQAENMQDCVQKGRHFSPWRKA